MGTLINYKKGEEISKTVPYPEGNKFPISKTIYHGTNKPESINSDFQPSNLHLRSKFTPSRFNLAKGGAQQGTYKSTGSGAAPVLSGVGLGLDILGILSQERAINNSPDPKMARAQSEWDNQYTLYKMGGGKKPINPRPQYYKKGGINIKPENKGKFNLTKKATGKSTEELTHSKNPVTKKRLIFAQNAKKWKHQQGGLITYKQK